MSDSESIKKMLRSVLQSSKNGVSVNHLQSEYRSLCGENIPLKKLGYSMMEDYLRSIPSVVRLEVHMGELKCFAAVCRETAHIAELVARQKSSKKSGRSQLVNCRMRFKPSNPYMLNMRPRSSLRQPSSAGASKWTANRSSNWSHGGFSASGDYRQMDRRLSNRTPIEHRIPPQQTLKQCSMPERKETIFAKCQKPIGFFTEKAPVLCPVRPVSRPLESESSQYDEQLVQRCVTLLLEKYSTGLWMSKLPEVYSGMFRQKLHPQVLVDLEKWTHICMVEKPTSRADPLIYPPLPSPVPRRSITPPTTPTTLSTITPSTPEPPSTPLLPPPVPKPLSPKISLARPTFIYPPQPVAASSGKLLPSVAIRNPAAEPAVAPRQPRCVNSAVNTNCASPTATLNQKQDAPPSSPICTPAPRNIPPLGSGVVPAGVRQRTKELLVKYSHGLWVHALPKLFLDTYKIPFPEHILGNLSPLLDICTVEYPVPHDKEKAILYYTSREDTEAPDSRQCQSPSGLDILGPVVPPCLVLPSNQYPSVLITDTKSSSAVTIRYVGEDYSNAQEAMEDTMQSVYGQSSSTRPLFNPALGQLVAIRGEDGDELARAQVMEIVAPNKIKVYYMDYGFSVETSGTNLLELHQDFLSLPFQSTTVRLAGLEAFSTNPVVLSFLDKLAVGKILLMETLAPCQKTEMPLVVLYDTSQEDDININATCLKGLQDKTMNNPLTVNTTYPDVCVTNVCADGLIYCQLPSRGTARLKKLLEETEAMFTSQVTSESLVSSPFSGKFCLARHKGKWSRAEITNVFGNRVMEVLFTDLGIPATVEVTDLREIPPHFLKDFSIIPPQATKCRLADLKCPEGDWRPEAVLWLKEAVLGAEDCKMTIVKLDQHDGDCLVYMHLFTSDSQELDKSINHQLAKTEWLHKVAAPNNNAILSKDGSRDAGHSVPVEKSSLGALLTNSITTVVKPLSMPPLLELPQPGQSVDVFVPVACHPGHFVLQQWQDLHKLVVLMGEMLLYYNQMWKTSTATPIQKGELCAAKIDKNWHRVQVKSILANGLVSIYKLDHGQSELVRSAVLQPLIEEFRQLPFQAITAQLAGVTHHQWSEEASMIFRNHVENRALVAQVESVQEVSEVKGELWERKLTVYLVDTVVEDRDLWIHNIMADISDELSSAA